MDLSLSELWELVMDREAWHATIHGVGKITWKRKWQLTAVFLPGKSPGQRSLTGYRELQRVGHDLASQQQQQQLYTSLRDFWWQIVNHGQHPSAHTLFLLGP